jgi:hypothetical protein
MALLYFFTGGENWADSLGFLSALSACSWNGAICDPTVVESYPIVVEIRFSSNNLRGQLPTDFRLGLLTCLQYFDLCKFTTMPSSELDTITLLRSLSYNLSPVRFCRR